MAATWGGLGQDGCYNYYIIHEKQLKSTCHAYLICSVPQYWLAVEYLGNVEKLLGYIVVGSEIKANFDRTPQHIHI